MTENQKMTVEEENQYMSEISLESLDMLCEILSQVVLKSKFTTSDVIDIVRLAKMINEKEITDESSREERSTNE